MIVVVLCSACNEWCEAPQRQLGAGRETAKAAEAEKVELRAKGSKAQQLIVKCIDATSIVSGRRGSQSKERHATEKRDTGRGAKVEGLEMSRAAESEYFYITV